MHLDTLDSDVQCHISFSYFISKFFNSERHVNVNSTLYLILRALLAVLCNKYNMYSKALPITESGRTVFHRLELNLRCGSPFSCIIRNNTGVIPGYTTFITIPKQLQVSATWSSHHQTLCIRKFKKQSNKPVATHTIYKSMAKILPMFTLEQATKTQMASRYTSEPDGGRVVSATPRPLYTQERDPGTHCTGSRVGLRASLDGCGKRRLPPAFQPRTVQAVASR